ncbi:MAG: methyltransferase domain-containing protein [Gemmataceae bacterium]|nr:methyltransferase domain-containing protein [Gemmataceae bacterium]
MSAADRAPKATGSAVIDALADTRRDQLIESYEQDFQAGVDLPQRASVAVRAVEQRRLDLLAGLPLGDLSNKTCLDLGVGGQGFGHRFPALQGCARGIGVDFSLTALSASAEVSSPNCTYLTSRGDRIDLEDGSADLIHAGDRIERVENLELLLEEFHRILKPGGLLVLTTAQAEPEVPCTHTDEPSALLPAPSLPVPRRGLLARLARTPHKALKRLGQMVRANPGLRTLARLVKRRLLGVAAAMSGDGIPEHLGALSYPDLLRLLAPRFEIHLAHGYGGALGEPVPTFVDTTTASAWAAQFADRPEHARRIVLLARRRDDYRPRGRIIQQRHHHESLHIHYRGGPWEVTGLRRAMTGRLATGGEASWLTLPVEGTSLVLHFWSNPWGGEAVIDVEGVHRTVNLYHPGGGFKRIHIEGLAPGRHVLRIAGSRNRDPRSHGNQVIFYQAISYQARIAHCGLRIEKASNPQSQAPGWRLTPPRSPQEREQLRQRVFARQWFHTLDLGDGIVTPGCDPSPAKVGYLGLPERLDGLSVLDIGAYDGFFSFECERRGAERVVAADHFCWTYGGMATKDGFDIARAALGSRVEEKLIPVEDISPQTVGTFDLVLFLGVLYHAPDMVRYLRMVRSVCKQRVILETEVDALDYPLPAAVFYPGASLNNDASNFWGPNLACVESMLREVGFRKIERICVFNMVRRGSRPFHRVVYHAFV